MNLGLCTEAASSLLLPQLLGHQRPARRTQAELAADGITGPQLESLLENRDEYTAERVFWVPPEARWQNLQNQAARPDIATLIDDPLHSSDGHRGRPPFAHSSWLRKDLSFGQFIGTLLVP